VKRIRLYQHRHLHRWSNRHFAVALLWTLGILAAAFAANVLGIYLLGGLDSWAHWLAETAGYFRLWRLGLYAVTLYGWLWMRRRLFARIPDITARRRLLGAEISAAMAITTLEGSLLLLDL
jgi:uncharacterized BrkB/YihY/UPF0761 family membrane protein